MNIKSRIESLEQSKRYRPPVQPIKFFRLPDEQSHPEEWARTMQEIEQYQQDTGKEPIVFYVDKPKAENHYDQ